MPMLKFLSGTEQLRKILTHQLFPDMFEIHSRCFKKSTKNPKKTQVPPTNQTKLEGEKVQFTCEAKAMPGNVTVRWFREGSPVREVAALETRVTIRKDGSLIINPVSADDSGMYTCEVSNGIGEPQSASAFLNIECK